VHTSEEDKFKHHPFLAYIELNLVHLRISGNALIQCNPLIFTPDSELQSTVLG
jgi:hypothetical protein